MGNAWAAYTDPEGTPHPLKGPSFDPMYGFPNGRKERVMVATLEEMESGKLPLEDRDFCAHILLKYRACRVDNAPWLWRCEHEKHEYLQCEYEDYILRMKEFERERRLLQRKKRIEARAQLSETLTA
ncbi:NADH dehydrogenase [ubiquinone] 1 beta subcomplex subunit 7 [Zootermopsis nevadensis]|uniref:NADH dehydrogenase [ubiquinone] 1 beta subcomplex subunit 7 n=1 Tax=Zootermopsis nevadensis TaxID=136037 RepID=A0A067RJ77_ZOONE|nr:NADH dehydrogenase [ubiquinone] 1 beta subcomplex subunit 7 [Zootermopsis nevadensis]KDR19402.1 NADH dehydrogenase [ubiquinone] 1 beta subcomplex subunit 7 [Zootermopsis nevadensis]